MENLTKISTRLPEHIIKKLKMHCALREIPIGVVISCAIEKYINDFEITVAQFRNNGKNTSFK